MGKSSVLSGIDRIDEYSHLFNGARAGLITNPTGINKSLVSTADILHKMGVLSCMFSPEHGVRGNAQAGSHVDTYIDEKTSLPVYSLYGSVPHIPRDVLDTLDIVAFDIQDIGARYYTYMYTLSYAMEDCAAANKKMVVFDRINPLGGNKAEGNILDSAFSSFVGRYPLAVRHNLTIGEYARYINYRFGIGCDLEVIPLSGWTRDLFYDDTDLFWVPPSPNIPTSDTAFCYVGTCLFEGTNLSEGRGTTYPFHAVGAPNLDGGKIADEFNCLCLPGVKARECYFTPTFSKHSGKVCGGVYLHITDKREFSPFTAGLYLLDIIRKDFADFAFLPPYSQGGKAFIDLLFGTDVIRSDGFCAEQYLSVIAPALADYEQSIKEYYLY